jgi:16S rRNA processing protein RimM
MTGARRVLLGRFGAAHGLKGEVLVHTFTADPHDIAAYGPLTDAAGLASYAVKVVRVSDKGVVARVAGVADRTAAEKLRGVELWIDRDRLPAADEGEFYHADLIGLKAVSPTGDPVGEVVGVHNYGAGDLLEVRLSGQKRTELLPFADPFVGEVDIAAGRVVVVMPVADPEDDPADDPDASGSPTLT